MATKKSTTKTPEVVAQEFLDSQAKAILPTLKVTLLPGLNVDQLPVKVGRGVLLSTTSNIRMRSLQQETLTTGVMIKVPDGYRIVGQAARRNLRVEQVQLEDDNEVRLLVQNLSPHFMDISPGDDIALLFLVKNQDFDLESTSTEG